jgi:hypothetical protein
MTILWTCFNWAPLSWSFLLVDICLFLGFFLSSTDPVECNFVTIFQIVALYSTVLSGYFLQNFYGISSMTHAVKMYHIWNNICSIPQFIFTLYFTALQITMLNMQLCQYASKHWPAKWIFGGKQWAGMGEQFSSWSV